MSIEDAVNQFLVYLELERNCSKLTIRNYRHYLNRFLQFGASQSPPLSDIASITPEFIRSFRLYLSRFADKHGLTLKHITQNYHLIALRAFLKFLIRQNIAALNPEKVELGKAESRSLKFLDREQVERLLNMPEISTPQGLRDKAIMEMLFSTGLRVSELVRLNRDSINIDRKEFGVIGKGGKPRVVFLSDSACLWLERYLKTREDAFAPLFIRYAGKKAEEGKAGEGFRLTARSIQRIVEKYARKGRLPIKITPHGIRHSFATDLLSGGADLRSIQEMLGHKNIATTQIYTHVTNPQLREIHQRFHRK
ncbi:tyrosine-type recombinase/integrase [Candidatus Gottesmanbacteria bacterium]|nr:tyrosine-type recombinase/integrase [Candidatus Gottesmanbacteria bacterium]MBI5451838.1 tyrosine-type recombinase/integrase [Candidatus Gottesmanbacteria bacterium]